MKRLRLATRKSPMALWQAHSIKNALLTHHADLSIEIIEIQTEADQYPHKPLHEFGSKFVFVKELEYALLQEKADFAVHCVKDLSVYDPPQLTLSAICKRDDPRDVLISPHYPNCNDMPPGTVIGTSSPRRQGLLQHFFPTLIMKPCRGNVNTRLQKLESGEWDAIVLAAAGLNRLGLQSHIADFFDPEHFTPAIGQGALGLQCRQDDSLTQSLLSVLNHRETADCVQAERAVNQRLGGDCHTSIGAYAKIEGDILLCRATITSLDGKTVLRSEKKGPSHESTLIGLACAEALLKEGAEAILKGL